MPTSILIKRSSTASAVPTTSDITTGELAVNTVDKRIFTNNDGTIVELGTYPSSQAVQGNATIGGTLGVSGATTLASGAVTGNFSVAGTLTVAAPSNDTDAASKGYVDAQVSAVLDGAPAALDTLNELAAALNDDANFATTVTNALATKLPLAGGTMTGTLDMGANKVTTTLTPTTDNELTRKGYVDSILGSATSAADSAAAAATSATNAANSATSASNSAGVASLNATSASDSATSASTSASAAASSATSAANSATSAATSATASAASATTAQALVDSIESFYLGAEASAPTADDNGDPLAAGDWYFNTTDSQTYIYDGSVWQAVAPDLIGDATPQLGGNLDLNGYNITGTGNIDVTGTATMDGLTVDGDAKLSRNMSSGNWLVLDDTRSGYGDWSFYKVGSNDLTFGYDTFSGASPVKAVTFDYGGDISFYEDTGTTPALTWDASAQSLNVDGPITADGLTVDGGSTSIIQSNNATTELEIKAGQEGVTTGTSKLVLRSLNSASGTNYARSEIASVSAAGGDTDLFLRSCTDVSGPKDRIKIDAEGDISFYEDTGTTAKFFWDASAESLGIGTSSPNQVLVVSDSSGDTTLAIDNGRSNVGDISKIDFRHNDITGSQIKSEAIEDFSTTANRTSDLQFWTRHNGIIAERMRIDSSGNVGIGTDSPQYKFDIRETAGTQAVQLLASDFTGFGVTAGSNLTTLKATALGSAGAMAFATGAGTERMRIDSSGHLIVPNGITLGTAVGTYNAANTLDDYEEGTVATPIAGGFTLGNGTITTAYTKVGRQVTVTYNITLGTTSAVTGTISLNLPFAASISGMGVASAVDQGSNFYDLVCRSGTTTADLYSLVTGSSFGTMGIISSTAPFTWVANDTIRVSVTYQTT